MTALIILTIIILVFQIAILIINIRVRQYTKEYEIELITFENRMKDELADLNAKVNSMEGYIDGLTDY